MRKLSRILLVLATMVLLLGLVSVADAQGRLPQPPVNVSNSQVSGYRTERYEGHRSGWETLEDSLPAANQFPWDTLETYVDTDVLPSAPYRYRIRSVNSAGSSSRAAGVKVVTAVDPPGLRIFMDSGRVTIGWDAPEDASIIGYRILRRVQWGLEKTLVSITGPGVTGWVDRQQVSPDTAYAYRLQALRDGRPGTRSRYLFALTPPLAIPTVDVSEPDGQDLCYGVVACVQTPLQMQRRA